MQTDNIFQGFLGIIQPAAFLSLVFVIGKLYQKFNTLYKSFEKVEEAVVFLKESQSGIETKLGLVRSNEHREQTHQISRNSVKHETQIINLQDAFKDIQDGIRSLREEFSKVSRVSSS